MERQFEKYLPTATHVFAYVPGSNRTKRAGSYRIFKSGGTWGDNGTKLTVPQRQLHAGTFTSQRGVSNYFTKVPRKDGIKGKEAARLPLGGNVVRVVGTDRTENPAAFGYVPDNAGGYGPLADIKNLTIEKQTAAYLTDKNIGDRAVDRRAPPGFMTEQEQQDALLQEIIDKTPAQNLFPGTPLESLKGTPLASAKGSRMSLDGTPLDEFFLPIPRTDAREQQEVDELWRKFGTLPDPGYGNNVPQDIPAPRPELKRGRADEVEPPSKSRRKM